MGANTRHYKALMKKNFINWKRTPCGSICEIICPVMLMLILWYARTKADPEAFEDSSYYTLRRPIYPIAKPELGNKFMVNMSDQQRQFEDYKGFFEYMDFWNLNVSTSINATAAIESFANSTNSPELAQFAVGVQSDIRALTNLTRWIEETPIANFTERIDFDAIEKLLADLGINDFVNVTALVDVLEDVAQELEDTLENPEALLQDVLGVNVTEIVDDFIEEQLGISGLETINLEYLGYMPLLDPFGAFFFYPSHCYVNMNGRRGATRFNSPVIGYVKTGSSIEEDVVEQLESLFKTQRQLRNGFAIFDVLGFSLEDVDTSMFQNFIREDEINQLAAQIGSRLKIDNTTEYADEFVKDFVPDMDELLKGAKSFGKFSLQSFESQSELDDYIGREDYGFSPDYPGICFAFAVNENESKNKYELELMYNDMWPGWMRAIPNQKKEVWNSYEYTYNTGDYLQYFGSGFVMLQNWVANTILKRKTGLDNASIVTMTVPSRLPPYIIDDFGQLITGVLSFCMFIMYIPPIFRTTYRIVAEKENKVKESMRMMGLKDFPYWASWYSYYTFTNTCLSTLVWIILYTKVTSRSAGWILFLIVWLYGQSLFGLIMVTQSVFTKARAAAIVTSLVYFGSGTFNYFVSDPDTKFEQRILASLSPTVAMIQSVNVMGRFETSQVGSSIDNIWAEYNNMTLAHGLMMQAFDCIWLTLLGLYLEQVLPKTYGVRRHPCFMFMPTWWGCCKKPNNRQIVHQTTGIELTETLGRNSPTKTGGASSDLMEETFKFETALINQACYERLGPEYEEKENAKDFLKIHGLKKEYENGFKAVNGLNVKMYSDQIFCLLGHNGAGKTSTISMLTGLIDNSEGEASLFGIDMFNNMDDIRKQMGVCPQHDVLFDLLTPEEHLDIFYEFKGADKSNKKKEIEKLLVDIGVADKRKNYAYQLSGGNKRKLSVAIALCGGSRFVLLDEPSSGLDIQARRQLWNMLRDYKKDRVMLLTTHYMDEADILGDRIGIMTAGKMTALGSSMFLKNRFGMGYVMTIVKNNPAINNKLMPYMHEKLGPDVTKLTEIQGEMSVQIPREYTALFKDFFTEFDDDLDSLDIQTYGVSITTLEQVFLEIGHNPNPKPKVTSQSTDSRDGVQLSSEPNSHPQSKAKISPMKPGSATEGQRDSRLINQNESVFPPIVSPTKGQKVDQMNDVVHNSAMKDDSISPMSDEPENNPIGALEQASSESQSKQDNPQDLEKANEDDENFEKFSLAESKLDKSFCNNFTAVFLKRLWSYKRSKKRVFTEIFLPSAFLVIGTWISSIDFSYRSDSRVFQPSMYPLKQKLLVNENIYDIANSDLTPRDLIQNLPGLEDNFDVTYNPKKPGPTFDDFGDDLFDFGTREAFKEPYMYGSYEIYQADSVNQTYKFVSYVNLTSSASAAIFPTFMYDAILKTATGDPEFEFTTRSTPYPLTNEVKKRVKTGDAGTVIFFSAISYSIVITVIISYLVVERTSQLKHVQVITGMRLSSYWIVNFIFDSFKLYVVIATSLLMFHLFGQVYPTATWILVAFPFGIIPFTYVFSYMFSVESAAQTFTFFCHMFVILFASLLIFILRVVPTLEVLGDQCHYAFRFFPSYSVASSLYVDASIAFISQIRNSTDGDGEDISPDPWHWNNNLLDLLAQGGHFFFWFFVLFLIEADLGKRLRRCYHCLCKRALPKKKEDMKLDADVEAEKLLVENTPADQYKIKVEGLRKVYQINGGCCNPLKPLVAVENISFGLQAGECFALLGVNGAGKSTTFKSLTAEVEPTEGSIHIGALDTRKDFDNIKKLVGYCPQTNAIFDYMSVEENIFYFARIKGIPSARRDELCNRAIKQLDLENHRFKLAGTLSGGNKRKLCVAMAIVGSPPIILLDEPSAGMDPEARRFMWRVVGQIASDKTSAVILTTHSMEEAEALSSKMGIMVKGGIFKCFGTPQHIKDKFGTGFVIEVKAQQPIPDEVQEVREGILNPESMEDPALKEALSRPTLSTEEASQILKAAEVPGIVIESILELDQRFDNEEDAEEKANEMLKRQFTLNEIASEIFIKGALFGVIESLCHEFVSVEIIEHYGSYMRLRVERHNKSIGFLFKLIEELKEEHQLEDYSVSQTTLEQIFQGFADLKFNQNVPTYCIDEDSGELAKIVFQEDQ